MTEPISNPFGNQVTFKIDHPANGLEINSGGDVDIEIVSLPGTNDEAFRSGSGVALPSPDGNTVGDFYIQFRVDDAFIYGGEPTSRVVFVLEYLDEGTDQFMIQYDALSGGPNRNGQFKETGRVTKTDTGKIKQVEIPVCDANFANRDQNADFRISDNGDGAETLISVAVQIPFNQPSTGEILVDSCGANPFDDQPDSEQIQECLKLACDGDTVLFTSGVNDPQYQGYLIDKTIYLVHPSVRSDLTFSSTNPDSHALLKATADLKGVVVHLFSQSVIHNPGEIDNITIQHLDMDGNRSERLCTGEILPGQEMPTSEGENDNWGSWMPDCGEPGDSWCKAGTLYLSGGFDSSDSEQRYEDNPRVWSTGFVVQDVVLSNTECGTAFAFQGAEFLIDSVTVDISGEHTHAPGCQLTDPDEPISAWGDGITFIGPAHQLTNNLIMDASDIGIVSFGGRDIVIADNIIMARPGNYGMFAGIAMHPNTLGLISGLEVTGNQVINQADTTCGGIHAGINIGVHTWANGCIGFPAPATYGTAEECTIFSLPPKGELCNTDTFCRTWGHIPEGETLTLANNSVSGTQVSYIISGVDVLGELILYGNQSIEPQLVDWEGDQFCVWTEGYSHSWGVHDFIAFNPAVDGWEEIQIYCMR